MHNAQMSKRTVMPFLKRKKCCTAVLLPTFVHNALLAPEKMLTISRTQKTKFKTPQGSEVHTELV